MKTVSVTTAAPVVVTDAGTGYRFVVPLTVAAIPGGGGTLTVAYQVSPGNNWTDWPDGTVTEKTVSVLAGPVYALRFTATGATGVVELGS